MQATFGQGGELEAKNNEVKTAEGLGGVNIHGTSDKKTQHDVGKESGREPVIKDTLVTERGEVGFDPGSGNQVATAGDPQTGNYKNAAGTVTTAGREDLKMK